jgi:hypothetical protein
MYQRSIAKIRRINRPGKLMGLNIVLRFLSGLVFFLVTGSGYCAPVDIPESATEMELARLLSFPQGEIVVNGKSYLVEDGTIYRLIQGRRYRPRCRDQEMEQIFPRIVFAELFRKGSVEVAKENLPILDRFGHALRWGSLKDHDLNIAVHDNTPAFAHTTASLSQSRAEWARNYIIRRWGIAHSRITASARLEQAVSGPGQILNQNEKPENLMEIVAVGTRGQGFMEACREGEIGF